MGTEEGGEGESQRSLMEKYALKREPRGRATVFRGIVIGMAKGRGNPTRLLIYIPKFISGMKDSLRPLRMRERNQVYFNKNPQFPIPPSCVPILNFKSFGLEAFNSRR